MTSRLHRTALTAVIAIALAGVAACAGILGIDPVALDSNVDEAGTSDALADTAGNEAGDPDAPGFDAGLEAALIDAPLPDAACLPCADAATNPCGIVCDAPTASEFLEVGNGFAFFGSRTRLERIAFDGSKRILIATGEIGGIAFHAPTSTLAWTVPTANEIHLRFSNGGPGTDKVFQVPSNGQLHPTHVYLTATSVVYFESSDNPIFGGG
ncbi:MAG: hypothetical protein JWM74_1445, partial [Myxococcaceae bacterium]|nr:hypothetical protein [Myxococcaceae bacterium]